MSSPRTPEAQRAHNQRWYADNKARVLAKSKRHNEARRKQRAELLATQDGLCYLCAQELTVDDAVIEHWHGCHPGSPRKTCSRCIRGVAHSRCNFIIGLANDNPALLRRFADSLEEANRRIL